MKWTHKLGRMGNVDCTAVVFPDEPWLEWVQKKVEDILKSVLTTLNSKKHVVYSRSWMLSHFWQSSIIIMSLDLTAELIVGILWNPIWNAQKALVVFSGHSRLAQSFLRLSSPSPDKCGVALYWWSQEEIRGVLSAASWHSALFGSNHLIVISIKTKIVFIFYLPLSLVITEH